jgi:hypothetical protein
MARAGVTREQISETAEALVSEGQGHYVSHKHWFLRHIPRRFQNQRSSATSCLRTASRYHRILT